MDRNPNPDCGHLPGVVGMKHSLAAGVGQEPAAADGVADVSGGDGERRGGGGGGGWVGERGGCGNCWPRTCETDCMEIARTATSLPGTACCMACCTLGGIRPLMVLEGWHGVSALRTLLTERALGVERQLTSMDLLEN